MSYYKERIEYLKYVFFKKSPKNAVFFKYYQNQHIKVDFKFKNESDFNDSSKSRRLYKTNLWLDLYI